MTRGLLVALAVTVMAALWWSGVPPRRRRFRERFGECAALAPGETARIAPVEELIHDTADGLKIKSLRAAVEDARAERVSLRADLERANKADAQRLRDLDAEQLRAKAALKEPLPEQASDLTPAELDELLKLANEFDARMVSYRTKTGVARALSREPVPSKRYVFLEGKYSSTKTANHGNAAAARVQAYKETTRRWTELRAGISQDVSARTARWKQLDAELAGPQAARARELAGLEASVAARAAATAARRTRVYLAHLETVGGHRRELERLDVEYRTLAARDPAAARQRKGEFVTKVDTERRALAKAETAEKARRRANSEADDAAAAAFEDGRATALRDAEAFEDAAARLAYESGQIGVSQQARAAQMRALSAEALENASRARQRASPAFVRAGEAIVGEPAAAEARLRRGLERAKNRFLRVLEDNQAARVAAKEAARPKPLRFDQLTPQQQAQSRANDAALAAQDAARNRRPARRPAPGVLGWLGYKK